MPSNQRQGRTRKRRSSTLRKADEPLESVEPPPTPRLRLSTPRPPSTSASRTATPAAVPRLKLHCTPYRSASRDSLSSSSGLSIPASFHTNMPPPAPPPQSSSLFTADFHSTVRLGVDTRHSKRAKSRQRELAQEVLDIVPDTPSRSKISPRSIIPTTTWLLRDQALATTTDSTFVQTEQAPVAVGTAIQATEAIAVSTRSQPLLLILLKPSLNDRSLSLHLSLHTRCLLGFSFPKATKMYSPQRNKIYLYLQNGVSLDV